MKKIICLMVGILLVSTIFLTTGFVSEPIDEETSIEDYKNNWKECKDSDDPYLLCDKVKKIKTDKIK